MDAQGESSTMCFILLVSKPGMDIDAASVQQAMYWFPDGTLHDCTQFDCSEVRQYADGMLRGQVQGLMPNHSTHTVACDAVTTH